MFELSLFLDRPAIRSFSLENALLLMKTQFERDFQEKNLQRHIRLEFLEVHSNKLLIPNALWQFAHFWEFEPPPTWGLKNFFCV